MPDWMEPYRELINNTGGNPIEELLNDRHTTAQVNLIRAALIVAVTSQVHLLTTLHNQGMLTTLVNPSHDSDAVPGSGAASRSVVTSSTQASRFDEGTSSATSR
jgi:hypothetical protein